MRKDLAHALRLAADAPGTGLAPAALVIARIEYPRLDPEPYLARIEAMGEDARKALEHRRIDAGRRPALAIVEVLNRYLFEDLRFAGNRDYEDPRNSCLNEVLDRRTGIPITLSLIYLEMAQRVGLPMDGVNFPGHFLVRCREAGARGAPGFIIDPFHGGTLLSERRCRVLLQHHAGSEVAFSRSLLAPATKMQILVRMLLNLKRLYVHMRSFPQARDVTELLVTLMPSALSELRDRGLLAYHLNDVTSALRDLQTYLKLSSMSEIDEGERQQQVQIWEHVKALRRRVASLS
jgi:regulator of sirC expression with transglutaminase-like and TPR domain